MKTVIYFFEFVLVSLLLIIFKILGYKLASNFGFFIGKTFGPLFRSKSLVIDNLKKSNIQINNANTDETYLAYIKIENTTINEISANGLETIRNLLKTLEMVNLKSIFK